MAAWPSIEAFRTMRSLYWAYGFASVASLVGPRPASQPPACHLGDGGLHYETVFYLPGTVGRKAIEAR